MTVSTRLKYKRYKHGDILEIPLTPHLNLFGYAKFISRSKEDDNINFIHPYLWLVFDFFSDIRIEKIEMIDTTKLLCNPLLMFWNLSLSGLDGWKVVGNQKIEQKELNPGYVRRLNHTNHAVPITEYKNIEWSVFLDTESSLRFGSKWLKLPWENVKHLEHNGNTSVNVLPFRIVFEWMKKYEPNFNLANLSKTEWLVYRDCCDIPPYSEIPENFKQKPILSDSEIPWKERDKLYFNYWDFYP